MNFSFSDHVALLDQFLTRRADIVERIEEGLLNVRDKDTARRRDRSFFDRTSNECFFEMTGLDPRFSRLKGQLAAAHLADGFEPIQLEGFSNEFDPLDLIIRAYEYWETRRWPGKSGRLAYAQSIYSAFMLRQLESLSLRMWDDGDDRAGDRLQAIQNLLARLNAAAVSQVHVRDVRWLVQTAQGPLTKYLEPYFRIATHISRSFTEPIRLGLHAAGAKLAGGHLRSQLRYRALEANRQIDDPVNLAIARNSNSMDGALLLRDLVPLLKAYERACAAHDAEARLEMADAILQGLSADPELFLVRLDLLGPLTMIEDLFVERGGDGRARYTQLGRTHLALLDQYRELIGRLAEFLKQDAAALAPSQDAYSPYGISYGFAAGPVVEHSAGHAAVPADIQAQLRGHVRQPGQPRRETRARTSVGGAAEARRRAGSLLPFRRICGAQFREADDGSRCSRSAEDRIERVESSQCAALRAW